jgi:hypothetical protein
MLKSKHALPHTGTKHSPEAYSMTSVLPAGAVNVRFSPSVPGYLPRR